MPLDPKTGVFWTLHGPEHGLPLMIGLPLYASFGTIFGAELAPVLTGYLDALTDRYRVLLLDYPGIGGSRDIVPEALTVDRTCADLLAVADAAGFERFAYWGYSWGAAAGLQLALRSDRISALVLGGWPPLAGPYAAILQAAEIKRDDPEPSSLKVLRNKAQYAQWIAWYRSLGDWPGAAERESVARLTCPRLVFFGAEGDLVEAGIPVPIASTLRTHRAELEGQGWQVVEIPGHGHAVTLEPALVLPPVRAFLDRHLAA